MITTLGCFAFMAKKRNGSELFDGCISSAAQEYRTDSQKGCSEGYCTWLLQNNFSVEHEGNATNLQKKE